METLFVFLLTFFFLALACKVPVAFSMGIAAVACFLYANLPVINMAQGAFTALDSIPFLAIPFFMLAGSLMEYSGISKSLLDLIDSIFGRVRGSLGVVVIMSSAAFGVLTGSALATISAIGKIVSPEMEAQGYRRGYTGALLAATCFLGILIPPSVPGILYALAANVPVTGVWLSTVGPAILFAVAYCVINYWRHGRREERALAGRAPGAFWGHFGKTIYRAIPALLMPIIIFGGIYGGICTATEAGALSAVYGILFYTLRKVLNLGETSGSMRDILLASAVSTVVIAAIMIFANVSSRAITLSGVSNIVAVWVGENISSPTVFLLIVNVIYLIMGTFLDINCALLLMTPLLLPAAKNMGIDPVHFGAITLVNLSVGFMTPPFANGIFMAAKITGASFVEVVREIWPFIAVGIAITLVTTYFPSVSLVFVK